MPSRATRPPNPVACLRAGQTWPTGKLRADAPPEAALVAEISRRLSMAMEGSSVREIARQAGLSPQTISNLLTGQTWGDVVTIARLERALGVALWGSEHMK